MNKKYKPSGLPFLQAQILEKIYLDIADKKKTKIEDLCSITSYPAKSKILLSALDNLVEKNFLNGNLEKGFQVPEYHFSFFQKVVVKNDFNQKEYSKNLLNFPSLNNSQIDLFLSSQDVSQLNKYGVIHKWYNYLEDFPYSLIEEKINEYGLGDKSLVVDPFCGSGTTLISSNLFHLDAMGFDANPLMEFVSRVKTTWNINLNSFKKIVRDVAIQFLDKVHHLSNFPFTNGFLKAMPKKELNQWLSPILQQEVSLLKEIIIEVKNKEIRDLLLLAMSKSSFDASYVSLCPGTTFYPFREKEGFWDLFSNLVNKMYLDLSAIQNHNHYGNSKIINDSCLNASKYLLRNSIDSIITSPPYPNDLEYTRQTRLELYLLDFVKSMDDVQEIKRKMTKGSTKLIFKESNSENYIKSFKSIHIISDKIYKQTKDKNWGFDYPRMVREYFGDMYLCLETFYPLMKKKSHFLLVVGDQTIKGVFIPVCDILIEMAKSLGYKNCRKELFRMRRSTGHDIPLPEEIVILEK